MDGVVEEVEDLTEVVEVEVVEVEVAEVEVAEDLDGVAAEVVLTGNKITVHQNMLSVSPRTTDVKEKQKNPSIKWNIAHHVFLLTDDVEIKVPILNYARCIRKLMLKPVEISAALIGKG